MKPNWVVVCHASELAEPNSYVVLPWGSNSEVVVSHTEGQLIAWDNRCPHRGARIYPGMKGVAPPVCAYHGRTARCDNLNRYHIRVENGMVLVCGHPSNDVEEPNRKVFLEMRGFSNVNLHKTFRLTMDCHWTAAVENALDFQHVRHVHAESLATMGLSSESVWNFEDGSSVERFQADSKVQRKLDKLRRLLPHWGSPGADYIHTFLFPFSCVSSTRGWTFSLQNYFPRADGRTEFYHRLYVPTNAEPAALHYYDAVFDQNVRVFTEDAAVCALLPPGPVQSHGSGHLDYRYESRLVNFRNALVKL